MVTEEPKTEMPKPTRSVMERMAAGMYRAVSQEDGEVYGLSILPDGTVLIGTPREKNHTVSTSVPNIRYGRVLRN